MYCWPGVSFELYGSFLIKRHKKEANMRLTGSAGLIVLAIWLILTGLIAIFNLSFAGMGLIMGVLAIVAGVLLLFRYR
jgi:uncharacterized membrane-anchored protein